MTTRETAEAIASDTWEWRHDKWEGLVSAVEAALTAAHEAGYEEGATELIVNAQVEYARGQGDERARCAGIADERARAHRTRMEKLKEGREGIVFMGVAARYDEDDLIAAKIRTPAHHPRRHLL